MMEFDCHTYVADVVKISAANLEYVNTNSDASAWGPASYALDEIRSHTVTPTTGWMAGVPMKRDFRSLVSSNTFTPGIDPTKWQDIGATNSVGMFASKLSEKTVKASGGYDGIYAVVVPLAFVDTVAFFGLEGSTVTVEVVDSNNNQLSTETKTLTQQSDVFDWLAFFTQVPVQGTQALFTGLFCMPGSKLRISIAGSTAKCGRCVIARAVKVGSSPQYGASWTLDNYTSADPDEFGYVNPLEKDYAPRNQVSVYVEPIRSNAVLDLLIRLRGTPTLLLASPDETYTNAMVNYGLVRDPSYVISSPSHNLLDFEFKGFV